MRLLGASLVSALALLAASPTLADDTAFHPEPKPFAIVHACWAANEDGSHQGSYQVRLVIDANVITTEAHVTGLDAAHTSCVEKLVSHWQYPLGHAGDVLLQVQWDPTHATAGPVK